MVEGLIVKDESQYTMDNTPEKVKILYQINQLEKIMRKSAKDIRRFEPKVKKATESYKRHMENMEVKKKMLKSFTSKRDELVKEFQQLP